MSKRGSPSLYELIRSRDPERAAPVQQPVKPARQASSPPARGDRPVKPPRDEPRMPGSWLRPGRILHIPIGYVLLAAAGAIMIMLFAYMMGYSRGNAEARILSPEEAARYFSEETNQAVIPRDPLDPSAGSQPIQRPDFGPDPRTARDPRGWGPMESDPRRSGLHYLILMTTDQSGAERFITFARERGLETYMIPVNNRRYRVFALPGFADHNTDEARRFRDDILRLGQIWMEQERSRVNPVGTSMWSRYG